MNRLSPAAEALNGDQIAELERFKALGNRLPGQPEKRYMHVALDTNVLAVLRVWPEVADAKVYVGAVPGMSHQDEWQMVAMHGTPQPWKIATALFHVIERWGLTYDKF